MTHAELAILGLIVEAPRHGYEIEQVIEERGMREWTEVAFSSIYYILRKLEKEKLIRGRLDQQPGKGPARKVYEITNAGRVAWKEATLETLSAPQGRQAPFLLGLVGLPALPTKEILAALRQYQERLRGQRDHVEGRWVALGGPLPLFLDGMFDYSLTLLEAELDWVGKFIAKLEEQG